MRPVLGMYLNQKHTIFDKYRPMIDHVNLSFLL